MSSFNKQGLRTSKQMLSRKNKEHVKAFYKILGDMEDISKQLDPSIEYNEDNINDYVLPLYGRQLDNMEKFVLLGKMHHTNFHNEREDKETI